jgi:hypothetical protein
MKSEAPPVKAETPKNVRMTKTEGGVVAVANVQAADVAIWASKGWKVD